MRVLDTGVLDIDDIFSTAAMCRYNCSSVQYCVDFAPLFQHYPCGHDEGQRGVPHQVHHEPRHGGTQQRGQASQC